MSGIGMEDDDTRYALECNGLLPVEGRKSDRNSLCDHQKHGIKYYRVLTDSLNVMVLLIVFIAELIISLQFVHQHYTARGATIGPNLSIEFESDTISPKLPANMYGIGWRIFPLFTPVVR